MMPKMLTIDGPKGAGKSEICQEIVEFLNQNGKPAVYHKHLRDETDEFHNMTELVMYANSPLSKEIVIVDRFVWSEYVMGIYLQRTDPVFLYRRCHAVENYMHNFKISQFLLLPGTATLIRRLAERPGDRSKLDMPLVVIHPLWYSALAVSKMEMFTNIDEHDKKLIMRRVADIFKVKI